MKFSKRVQSLTTSPIRKLSPYAAAAEKKGKKNLSFKYWTA